MTSEAASDIPDAAFELVAKEREWEPTAFTLLRPISSQKIPFEISSELGSKLSAGYMSFLEKSEEFYQLSPLASNCPECGFIFVESSAVTRTLYTMGSAISCIGKLHLTNATNVSGFTVAVRAQETIARFKGMLQHLHMCIVRICYQKSIWQSS